MAKVGIFPNQQEPQTEKILFDLCFRLFQAIHFLFKKLLCFRIGGLGEWDPPDPFNEKSQETQLWGKHRQLTSFIDEISVYHSRRVYFFPLMNSCNANFIFENSVQRLPKKWNVPNQRLVLDRNYSMRKLSKKTITLLKILRPCFLHRKMKLRHFWAKTTFMTKILKSPNSNSHTHRAPTNNTSLAFDTMEKIPKGTTV